MISAILLLPMKEDQNLDKRGQKQDNEKDQYMKRECFSKERKRQHGKERH